MADNFDFTLFELKFVCIRMSVRTPKTLIINEYKCVCVDSIIISISAFRIPILDIDCEYIKISTCRSSLINKYYSKFTLSQYNLQC